MKMTKKHNCKCKCGKRYISFKSLSGHINYSSFVINRFVFDRKKHAPDLENCSHCDKYPCVLVSDRG